MTTAVWTSNTTPVELLLQNKVMFPRKITTNLRRTSIEQPTSIKRPLASTSRVRTQLIKLTAHDLHLHVNISEELLSPTAELSLAGSLEIKRRENTRLKSRACLLSDRRT